MKSQSMMPMSVGVAFVWCAFSLGSMCRRPVHSYAFVAVMGATDAVLGPLACASACFWFCCYKFCYPRKKPCMHRLKVGSEREDSCAFILSGVAAPKRHVWELWQCTIDWEEIFLAAGSRERACMFWYACTPASVPVIVTAYTIQNLAFFYICFPFSILPLFNLWQLEVVFSSLKNTWVESFGDDWMYYLYSQ